MNISIDFHIKKPISEQLEDEVRRSILEGEIEPGQQLPTVRQLAAQTHINFNTVARVYRLLDQDGWISTQQGRGTYVLDRENKGIVNPPALRTEAAKRITDRIIHEAERLNVPITQLKREVDKQLLRSKNQISIQKKSRRKRTNTFIQQRHLTFCSALEKRNSEKQAPDSTAHSGPGKAIQLFWFHVKHL